MPRTAKDIKGLFVAAPGCSLLYADYSQLELRCIAWLTDDEFLLDCYRRGIDLHGAMAEVLFGEDYTPDQRSLAKRLNFGQPKSQAEVKPAQLSGSRKVIRSQSSEGLLQMVQRLTEQLEQLLLGAGAVAALVNTAGAC